MEMPLSSRITRLSESLTIAIARKSRDMKAMGIDILDLSLGEPDFNTPDIIKEAAKKAIDDNFSHYTHVSGYLALREAISHKFKRDNNLDYDASQIVVSTGAKQSIANAVLSIISPGDEVLIPVPYWVSYVDIVKLAEGVPVLVKAGIEDNFKVTGEQLKKNITPKTRLLIFSSPCNPTGSVYSRAELEDMTAALEAFPNIYIISDEIYEHINFVGRHESIGTIPSIKDRVITINGVSKSFAMTGWRVGFMGAPLNIARACDKIQGQITSATCSIAQKATETAVTLDPSVTYSMRDAFKKRRDFMLELLKDIPGLKVNIPDGAFYLFTEVSSFFGKKGNGKTILSGTDLCDYLLDDAKLAIVPGSAFGDDNHIRITYAASDNKLKEAMARLKTSLLKLS
jgi:aspartate aminotransferase